MVYIENPKIGLGTFPHPPNRECSLYGIKAHVDLVYLISCTNTMSMKGGKELRYLDVVTTIGEHKLVMIKHLRTENFDRTNYHTWRALFVAMLSGHVLMNFVEKKILLNTRLLV